MINITLVLNEEGNNQGESPKKINTDKCLKRNFSIKKFYLPEMEPWRVSKIQYEETL
jgi:hypothetical protein